MVHSAIAHLLLHAKKEEARKRAEIARNAREQKRRHKLLAHCRHHVAKLAVYSRHLREHIRRAEEEKSKSLLRKVHGHLKTLAKKEGDYANVMEKSLETDKHAALKAMAARHHLHRIKSLLEQGDARC